MDECFITGFLPKGKANCSWLKDAVRVKYFHDLIRIKLIVDAFLS